MNDDDDTCDKLDEDSDDDILSPEIVFVAIPSVPLQGRTSHRARAELIRDTFFDNLLPCNS